MVLCPMMGLGLLILSLFRLFDFMYNTILMNQSRIQVIPEKKGGEDNSASLAIFITGCDVGLGRAYAFDLAKRGFVVFAGCLRENSLRQFDDASSIHPVKLDVTKDEDPIQAAKIVSQWLNDDSQTKPRHLHAIINNAGIGCSGPIDWTPLSDFENVMEVNYFGVIRTIKAFLPILKSQSCSKKYTDARIINMISFAAYASMPGAPAYVISKHALERFSSTLRLEMRSFDLSVITLNPSMHKTSMLDVCAPQIELKWNNLTAQIQNQYGKDTFHKWINMTKAVKNFTWDSEMVVQQIRDCVELRYPPPDIFIGMDAKYVLIFLKILPTWLSIKIFTVISPVTERNFKTFYSNAKVKAILN